jgi:protein-S-isoprenylcysteine O-methyltransferase Ste14
MVDRGRMAAEMVNPMNAGSRKTGLRYVVQRLALIVIGSAVLFMAAGTFHWMRGWIWVASASVFEAASLAIIAAWTPETLKHRGASHEGVKPFDKGFIIPWLIIAEFVTPVLSGLDRRLGGSHMPLFTLYAGIPLFVFAWSFGTWAMITNEHFEQFVRIQTDRRQRVVSSGPYRIVRHPGYAAHIAGGLAMPLILGTGWTFLPVGAVILIFVMRTRLEDRMLRRELEGYESYTRKTRFRLIPGVW